MEESAYLFESTAGVLYLLVGVPLWRLGSRRGDVAARLIGATFLLWGASYLLYNAPVVAANEVLLAPCFFAGRVVYDCGALAIGVFTWRVFRADEAWSRGVVLATLACLVVGVTGSAAVGDWEGVAALSNPWFWLEWLGMSLPLAWVAIEGLLEYANARRRARLGLSDLLVCNRFLLWGLTGLMLLASNVVLIPQYVEYEQDGVFSFGMDALVGVFEIATVGLIWLVFFPPAWYRRRIGAPRAPRPIRA